MVEPLPNPREELERKTVELLEVMALRVQQRRMEPSDLRAQARALWHVTSGLVDSSVSELISMAADEGTPRKLRRQFLGAKGALLTVEWLGDEPGFKLISRNAADHTSAATVKEVSAEINERASALDKLFRKLELMDFIDIT